MHDIESPRRSESTCNFRYEISRKIWKKAQVCNAIGAHHDEIEMTSMISPIVQICDKFQEQDQVRREIVEQYSKNKGT